MVLKNVKSIDHRFTDAQYDAIDCVLPLISYQPIVTQQMRKAQIDAMQKIRRQSIRFQNHEINAIISAVELAVMCLSGQWTDMLERVKQDGEWYQEMKLHYFVLNALRQEFQQLIQEFDLPAK